MTRLRIQILTDRERQREIINEIEEARKEMEKKNNTTKKSGWGIFGRKKAKRESWEVYEDGKGGSSNGASGSGSKDGDSSNHGVLFDSETASEEMAKNKNDPAAHYDDGDLEIKELKSTLPPMKLDVGGTSPKPPPLRETKSSDATTTLGGRSGYSSWGHNDNGHADDEVQMSFDTDYRVPAKASTNYETSTNSQPWGAERSSNHVTDTSNNTAEKRPDYKTTKTAPAYTPAPDPWADDDDPDFGKEKDIEMTFA